MEQENIIVNAAQAAVNPSYFDLHQIQYVPGANELSLTLNAAPLTKGVDWEPYTKTSFSVTVNLNEGDIIVATAVSSSESAGSADWRFVDANGHNTSTNTSDTVNVTATQRVVITHLTHSLSGGSTDWSLTAGARTVFANGAKKLDDNTPGTIEGAFAVTADHRLTNGELTFGKGESVTIASGITGNVIWRYRVEEVDA